MNKTLQDGRALLKKQESQVQTKPAAVNLPAKPPAASLAGSSPQQLSSGATEQSQSVKKRPRVSTSSNENNNSNERNICKKRKEAITIQDPGLGPSGIGNTVNKDTNKPKDDEKNTSTLQDSEPGLSGSGNKAKTRKEVKKEKTPEVNPANQIVHQTWIKTEPRDHGVTDQLNKEQKASVTFETVQQNGKRIIRVKMEKLKTLNQQLRKVMRKWQQEAGLDTKEAVWVCEGNTISGEETGQSLDGKIIVLKKN